MRDDTKDAIRIGKVSSINEMNCTAKVTFEDRQATVSKELPIVVPFTLKDQAYHMPAIGERVLCIFYPNAPTNGFILGSFYADSRKPKVGDKNKKYTRFEDGTSVEYDKKNHKLTIDVRGKDSSIAIKVDGKMMIESSDDISLTSDGHITLTARKIRQIEVGE